MDWNFEWITTWEGVRSDRFMRLWHDVYATAEDAHVFASPDVAMAWVEGRGAEAKYEARFAVGRKASMTVVVPLIQRYGRWRDGRPRMLQPVGHDDFDYHDPLCSRECGSGDIRECVQALLNEVDARYRNRVDALELPRVHDRMMVEAQPVDVSPFLELRGFASADELLASLGREVRQDLRRKRRRLESHGPVRLEVATAPEQAMTWLPGFCAAYRNRWGEDGKPVKLYETMLRRGVPQGVVHVSVLTVGEDVVSWHIGFADARRFYWYKPVFAEEWAAYSPGKVHLLLLLEMCIDMKVQVFDFLRGAEGYKMHFTKAAAPLFRVWHTLPGMRAAVSQSVRQIAHATIKPAVRACRQVWARRTRRGS